MYSPQNTDYFHSSQLEDEITQARIQKLTALSHRPFPKAKKFVKQFLKAVSPPGNAEILLIYH